MKYEPQVSGFTTKFWTFLWSKSAHTRKIVVYLILISTLPVLRAKVPGNSCVKHWWKKAPYKTKNHKTSLFTGYHKTCSVACCRCKNISRLTGGLFSALSLWVNGPFLVSGFVQSLCVNAVQWRNRGERAGNFPRITWPKCISCTE